MAAKLVNHLAILCVFLLLKTVASHSISGYKTFVPNATEFIYLGNLALYRSGAESDYYVSVNPAAWNNAEQDCDAHWSANGGSFLMVETTEELTGLNLLLERFGSGQLYWTGGLFTATSGWVWSSTGELILPSLLDTIPPSTKPPTSQDRLILNHQNRFTSNFDILQDSQPQRYICEVKKLLCKN